MMNTCSTIRYFVIWCFDVGGEECHRQQWDKIVYRCLTVLRSGDFEGCGL